MSPIRQTLEYQTPAHVTQNLRKTFRWALGAGSVFLIVGLSIIAGAFWLTILNHPPLAPGATHWVADPIPWTPTRDVLVTLLTLYLASFTVSGIYYIIAAMRIRNANIPIEKRLILYINIHAAFLFGMSLLIAATEWFAFSLTTTAAALCAHLILVAILLAFRTAAANVRNSRPLESGTI